MPCLSVLGGIAGGVDDVDDCRDNEVDVAACEKLEFSCCNNNEFELDEIDDVRERISSIVLFVAVENCDFIKLPEEAITGKILTLRELLNNDEFDEFIEDIDESNPFGLLSIGDRLRLS
ncbi:hypothetical protein DERP_012835 [Dermatophagoides pteronyssinus]|uniref:Uncharacterized protein n=1 Tax=Dermatophagoides pteronyssinus TaxID=6956 RepID=A0ABQ8JFR4_DERPT|nr:hypothetical protein DERP_012835 [Dermatophagoides pteronyssinus]